MKISKPYLLFLGDAADQLAAKTAKGIKDWRPENCVGQYRLDGCNADVGLPDMSIAEAREAGAAELPTPVRGLMRLTAKVMTNTAYWI